jgi:hypothetical protein
MVVRDAGRMPASLFQHRHSCERRDDKQTVVKETVVIPANAGTQ